MRDTHTHREREREAETQAEVEAGSMQGGTRPRVSRIVPWAKGRRETAEPPRDPQIAAFKSMLLYIVPRGHKYKPHWPPEPDDL